MSRYENISGQSVPFPPTMSRLAPPNCPQWDCHTRRRRCTVCVANWEWTGRRSEVRLGRPSGSGAGREYSVGVRATLQWRWKWDSTDSMVGRGDGVVPLQAGPTEAVASFLVELIPRVGL